MFALAHLLPDLYCDRTKMSVEAVIGTAVPLVLDDDVFAVARRACNRVRINDHAIGDRTNFVGRIAVSFAAKRTNIHPFVKARVDDAGTRFDRITHEAILTALPGG